VLPGMRVDLGHAPCTSKRTISPEQGARVEFFRFRLRDTSPFIPGERKQSKEVSTLAGNRPHQDGDLGSIWGMPLFSHNRARLGLDFLLVPAVRGDGAVRELV